MINFERLKDIREDNDLTQEQIANILNAKRRTYASWELGDNIIPLNYLCKFADYFNISIDYTLGLTNNRNTKKLIKGFEQQNLSNNMKIIREHHKLSQKNLADILNISQSNITRYEKGQVLIPIPILYKFCKYFKVSFTEVCGKGKID